MGELPGGTVTFLFTDLEGSTRAWEQDRVGMEDALARHDSAVRSVIESTNGTVFTHTGDGLGAAFRTATDALQAAVAIQSAIGGELKARVAVHTGEAQQRDGNYFGPTLNRVARILGAGHGGQILVSQTTEEIAGDRLPGGTSLTDLGEHRLRDLTRPVRLFQLVHPDLGRDFPALRSLSTFPSNLPVQVSSFIGRDRDVAQVSELLDEARVVTLTGVGGVGKTRLAVHVGAEVLPRYPDGAWICELAAVTDASVVPDAIATTVGVQQELGESMEDSLVNSLRSKQSLLVLDNCEHLLGPVSKLVDRIVRTCPTVSLLATSREPLAVDGERVWPLRSLALPISEEDIDQDVPAVQLFCDRARAVRPDFDLTSDNARAVASICERLDGVPLAIELAAARVRSMTPGDVASRLDERFRLLTGGPRTAVERHRTLQATVDWSYELCNEAERLLFDRLAVFSGGFTVEAAEAVCAGDGLDQFDIVDVLTSLVDRSMVNVDESGAIARYSMLETLRTYAQDRLDERGEADAVRRRHAEHFLDFVVQAEDGLKGPDELAWVRRTKSEFANVRTAFFWAAGVDDTELAIRIVVPLYDFAYYRQHLEVYAWAERALELPGARDHPMTSALLGCIAMGLAQREAWDDAIALANEAIELEGRAGAIASICPRAARANASAWGGRPEFVDFIPERVEFARRSGDLWTLAAALMYHSVVFINFGQPEGMPEVAEECMAVARQTGNPTAIGWAHLALGRVAMDSDTERSIQELSSAMDIAASVENSLLAGLSAGGVWMVAEGRYAEFAHLLRPAVDAWDRFRVAGNTTLVNQGIALSVGWLHGLGYSEDAAISWGYVRKLPRLTPGAAMRARQSAERVEAALGSERFEELATKGERLSETEMYKAVVAATETALDELTTERA